MDVFFQFAHFLSVMKTHPEGAARRCLGQPWTSSWACFHLGWKTHLVSVSFERENQSHSYNNVGIDGGPELGAARNNANTIVFTVLKSRRRGFQLINEWAELGNKRYCLHLDDTQCSCDLMLLVFRTKRPGDAFLSTVLTWQQCLESNLNTLAPTSLQSTLWLMQHEPVQCNKRLLQT